MIEHVQNTIAGLDQKILSLQNLRQNLLEVFGPIETAPLPIKLPPAPTPPQEDQPVKARRKYTRRSTPVGPTSKAKTDKLAKFVAARRAPAATSAELLIQIIAKLKQPFSAPDLIAKSGIDAKKAANTISKMIAKRWLERVSRGAYERTDKFGGDKESAADNGHANSESAPAPAVPARTASPSPVASVHDLSEGSLERKVYFQAVAGPQPFTAVALAIALGCSKDAVAISIIKLERKGYMQYVEEEDGEKLYKTTNK